MYRVIYFESRRGIIYVRDFIRSLCNEGAIAKVLAYIEYLSIYGPASRRPYVDYLEDKIYELRPSFGRLEMRVLYFYDKKDIILTHAFLKKTRETPQDEIDKAKEIMRQYKNRIK
jgi:phage-related protein